MQTIFSQIIINIFLFLLIVEIILSILDRVIVNILKKEKSRSIQAIFPELSKEELKFRRESLASYYKINSNNSFRIKIGYFFMIVLLIAIVATTICAFSDNYSGICFGLAALFISMGMISLSAPTYQNAQAFWKKYLIENPDNPLKFVLLPDKKDLKYVKFSTINSYFRIFCGLYSLLVAIMLFQQNL
ncbi:MULTISPECIES: hypothetical protein [unclassified Enterococcus]|uniref:hypothetical protein n=1 Tax=unclassified Enterococcus TaxID=2608891 RepID=UPI0013ECDFB0|nr:MULTISPECIES: hypothetical protein [unclassified Enterococcus]